MDSFEEILQKKHLKRTKARVMILKVLQKSLPMTAGDVYEAVRKRDTKLSLSTEIGRASCRERVSLSV